MRKAILICIICIVYFSSCTKQQQVYHIAIDSFLVQNFNYKVVALAYNAVNMEYTGNIYIDYNFFIIAPFKVGLLYSARDKKVIC